MTTLTESDFECECWKSEKHKAAREREINELAFLTHNAFEQILTARTSLCGHAQVRAAGVLIGAILGVAAFDILGRGKTDEEYLAITDDTVATATLNMLPFAMEVARKYVEDFRLHGLKAEGKS